jgi:DNA-binding MarR family transcriptional regulator
MNPPNVKPGKDTGPASFELERFLPYRLSLLTNTVSGGIAERYRANYEISVTEWRILAVLGRYPGLSASEIIDRTAMDKVTISRAVKCLVDRNLLQRVTDPADRRRIRLHITPGRGQKLLAEVIPLARQYESRLLQALDRNEQKALFKTLQKLQAKANSLKSS